MRRRWKVVVACTPAIVIQGLDVTMVTLALPLMGVALSAQLADLQWVVASFALAMVSLLPTSAAIGDLYGRRRALLMGYGMLALGSALAWSASSIGVLIMGRIGQGIGMALGAPNSFALVGLAFPRGERGRALGLWTAISSVVFTVSPVAAGWLVESFGFNAVFAPSLLFAAHRGRRDLDLDTGRCASPAGPPGPGGHGPGHGGGVAAQLRLDRGRPGRVRPASYRGGPSLRPPLRRVVRPSRAARRAPHAGSTSDSAATVRTRAVGLLRPSRGHRRPGLLPDHLPPVPDGILPLGHGLRHARLLGDGAGRVSAGGVRLRSAGVSGGPWRSPRRPSG